MLFLGEISHVKDYLQANIIEGTTIHSDGLRSYRRLPELGYVHRWVFFSQTPESIQYYVYTTGESRRQLCRPGGPIPTHERDRGPLGKVQAMAATGGEVQRSLDKYLYSLPSYSGIIWMSTCTCLCGSRTRKKTARIHSGHLWSWSDKTTTLQH